MAVLSETGFLTANSTVELQYKPRAQGCRQPTRVPIHTHTGLHTHTTETEPLQAGQRCIVDSVKLIWKDMIVTAAGLSSCRNRKVEYASTLVKKQIPRLYNPKPLVAERSISVTSD